MVVFVHHGNGLYAILAHHGRQIAQVLIFADGEVPVDKHVFHSGVYVGEQKRGGGLEIVEGEARFVVELAGTGREDVHAQFVLEVGIANGRTDGVGVGIAVPNGVNGAFSFHRPCFL